MGPADVLGGLPAYLAVLCDGPGPDEAMAALVTGPLAQFSAVGALLSRRVADELVLVGAHGWQPGDLDGYERMAIDADLPSTRAFREMEPVVGPGTIEDEFVDIRPHRKRWARMRERGALGAVVAFPVIATGRSVGPVGFACRHERAWTPAELALLDAVGSALGMWQAEPWGVAADGSLDEARLSERQVRILTAVRHGRTNPAIASALGYSVSTVKQDIHAAMRLLGATSRMDAAQRAQATGLLGEAP